VREVIRGTQFKRDVKLAEKRGKNMAKLRELIVLLVEASPLPPAIRITP
jgi:mRNA interferase YafQ